MKADRALRSLLVIAGAACLTWAGAAPARAERTEAKPRELQDVGITEHYDAQVPLELKFTDSDGREVALGELFDGTVPTILTMNYSSCPMLCDQQLNGLVDVMRRMPWTLGEKFRIVTISIDPTQTPEQSRAKKELYMKRYGRAGTAAAWRFLTTTREADIRKVADTVGFGYRYLPEARQYAHTAVLMVCTPDGRLSRYIGGVAYDPQTVRLALVEAGQGKIGSTWDRIVLYCFHYDETTGKYGPAAFRIMQVGGLLTVVVLGSVLSLFWVHEVRKGKRKAAAAAQTGTSDGEGPDAKGEAGPPSGAGGQASSEDTPTGDQPR